MCSASLDTLNFQPLREYFMLQSRMVISKVEKYASLNGNSQQNAHPERLLTTFTEERDYL